MLNVYVWGSTVTRARFLDGAAEVNQCGGGHGTLKTHWVFFFFLHFALFMKVHTEWKQAKK